MQTADFRDELRSRIEQLQKAINELMEKRHTIDAQISQAEAELKTWREAYQIEAERLGEPRLPLFSKDGKTYRFAGMRLTDAIATIRKENPEITKKQARQILESENFDFRGKNPGNAIHFAWVSVDRRGKPNLKYLAQKVARMGNDK